MPVFRLQAFGTLQLRDASGNVAVSQRLRLAVLTFLAQAGGQGSTRDRLLGVFWPEKPQENARHSLDQLLSALRQQVGTSLFLSPPDPVRLDLEQISSDARDFELHLRAGRDAAAVALYQGPFLDGFHLGGSGEFDNWAEGERSRLREACHRALERLATAAQDAGDHDVARDWWRRLAAVEPLNARVASGLMVALARNGDAAAALAHGRAFTRLVAEETGGEPDWAITLLTRQIETGVFRLAALPPPDRRAPAGTPDLRGVNRALGQRGPTHRATRALRGSLVALAVLLATMAAWWLLRPASSTPAAAGLRLAIPPFQVLGGTPGDQWLGEGVPDLLTRSLDGTPGLVPVDPRRTMSAWQEITATETVGPSDSEALMRRTEAALVVRGQLILRTPLEIEILAEVVSSAGSLPPGRMSVRGSIDSLSVLVDRSAAQILTAAGREGAARADHLRVRPLPALKAFLRGRSHARRGEVDSAITAFSQALAIDSTFGLAGLELAVATGWLSSTLVATGQGRELIGQSVGPGGLHRPAFQPGWRNALRMAFLERATLPLADRALLDAIVGPRFPDPTTSAQHLEAWERAVQLAPDRPETRYGRALALLYLGPTQNMPDARPSARAEFTLAARMDPGYPLPRFGLAELAAAERDTAGMREQVNRYLRLVPSGELADYLRWHLAVATADSSQRRTLRDSFDGLPTNVLSSIVLTSQTEGLALDDAELAARIILGRAGDRDTRRVAYLSLARLALNRGRPGEAQDWIGLKSVLDARAHIALFQIARFGLFWDGDTVAARRALRQLEVLLAESGPNDATVWDSPRAWWRALWFVAQDQLERGEDQAVAMAISRLRGAGGGEPDTLAAYLEALVAAGAGGPAGRRAAHQLEALAVHECCGVFIDLVAGRTLRDHGDTAAALRAFHRGGVADPPDMLSTYLREEGVLALASGDTSRAVRALRHFLALQAIPEPARQAQVDSLSGLLSRLGTRP